MVGSQAEKGGFEVVGNAQLLKFPRRVKASHKRVLVVCGLKVAARQEAQGRSNNPNAEVIEPGLTWGGGNGGAVGRPGDPESWPVLAMDGEGRRQGSELSIWAAAKWVVLPTS